MRAGPRVRELLAPAAYGAVVLVGTIALGLGVLPLLGASVGAFATRADAQAYCSLATLKGFPWLVGLSVLSTLVQPEIAGRRLPARIAWTLVNVVLVWLVAAAVAIGRLG